MARLLLNNESAMKPTKYLSINMTRTIILILGIIVALLLTFNSGLIGDSSTFTSSFQRLFADTRVGSSQFPDQLQKVKYYIQAGKNVYDFTIDFLNAY
jgi:hypothetical protein